jgi:DNA-binding NtrC family response regulator
LLRQIQQVPDAPPVVVMSGWGTIELAVEAMRLGAKDFTEKPWNNERLVSIVRTQIDLSRALRRAGKLEAELQSIRQHDAVTMIAESRAMQPVVQLIRNISRSDASVLITGENGVGKGVVARVLHANSERASQPLVTIDAASLSEAVFESELFGHVKGAFTDARASRVGRIELADGGTVFLDEIGNIPLKLQAKLLRVVERGEFEPLGSSQTHRANVRYIAATNADLKKEVAEGRFRQDLLFRLNTIEIHIPALRDRPEDIPILAAGFLATYAQRYRKQLAGFAPPTLQALLNHVWPGNVRELDHVIERAVLMASLEWVAPSDLGLGRVEPTAAQLEDVSLETVERILIEKALARHEGNVSHAAASLGLSRTALYRRLEKHGLNIGDRRS